MTRPIRGALVTLVVAGAAALLSALFFLGFLQSELHYQCEFVGVDRQYQCQDGVSYIGVGLALAFSIAVVLAIAAGVLLPGFQHSTAARWSALILAIASILPGGLVLFVSARFRGRDVEWPAVLGVVPGILIVCAICSVLAAIIRNHMAGRVLIWLSLALYGVVAIVHYELLMSVVLSAGILLSALYFLPPRQPDAPAAG